METLTDSYERAKGLYENGMTAAALELLEFHLADQPHDAASIELRGIIFHSIRAFEQARNELEAAGLIRPLTASGLLALAESYWFTGKRQISLQLYDKLAKREDVHHCLLSGLAMGLGRAKRYHDALEVCRRAAAHNPVCHHARYGVAYYMSKIGYPPELIYPIIHGVADMAAGIFHYRMAVATILCRMQFFDRAYLAVADASVEELNSVTCRCCLERLIGLYKAENDGKRLLVCQRRRLHARDGCQRRS